MKNVNKNTSIRTILGTLLFTAALDLHAIPTLTGEIGMFGVFQPIDSNWNTTTVSSATGIDFNPNLFKVVSSTGSFSSIANGTLGDITDFQFAPGLGINDGSGGVTSVSVINDFWSVDSFTFALTSIAEGYTSDPINKIVLEGTGVISAAGYADTLGSWIFTGQTSSSGGVFTWSAGSSAMASVPEPGLLALLGIGLAGFAVRKKSC